MNKEAVMDKEINRRNFLKIAAAGGSLCLGGSAISAFGANPRGSRLISPGCRGTKVKVARIYMGTSHGLWPEPKMDFRKEINFYESQFDKLKDELEYLKTTKRREIADRIQKAKEMGDLSENAEYSEAKDAQAFNDGRIAELTQMLKNLTVVKNGGKSVVGMGSVVTVKANDKERVYTIVSFNEADPINGKISNESPIGKAFIDRKKGDIVTVSTPKGSTEYEILKIE